jgi:cold shock CspA family protein
MGRSHESFNKREVRNRKEKKRKEKEKKKLEKKDTRDGNDLDSMIAYVDEFGNISSTPPDLTKKVQIKAEDIEVSIPRNRVEDTSSNIRKGIVTFFNHSKGFGFIRDLESKDSIFVHINSLSEPVEENTRVSFEVERGIKGLNAVNVKIDRGTPAATPAAPPAATPDPAAS